MYNNPGLELKKEISNQDEAQDAATLNLIYAETSMKM